MPIIPLTAYILRFNGKAWQHTLELERPKSKWRENCTNWESGGRK